ncbi:MAG: DUF4258 domain-containing protein [Chloroflexi bacterium]|nr:DUF4258 domain-containing protein [Chloroflexota bacterium]
MPPRILSRIRAAVRHAAYDMTVHAIEEMAEDDLDIDDVESAVLNGRIAKVETDDPRGARYTVFGPAVDRETPVGVVVRFTANDRLLIITVYQVIGDT